MMIRLAGMIMMLMILVAGCQSERNAASKSMTSQEPVPARPYANVDAAEFQRLSTRPNTVILDVRTPQEYAEGHIPGALNIDVNSPDFQQKVGQLDKSRTYLVQCRSGARSVRACNELSKLDFPRIYNLTGGMNEWKQAGMPVEK